MENTVAVDSWNGKNSSQKHTYELSTGWKVEVRSLQRLGSDCFTTDRARARPPVSMRFIRCVVVLFSSLVIRARARVSARLICPSDFDQINFVESRATCPQFTEPAFSAFLPFRLPRNTPGDVSRDRISGPRRFPCPELVRHW